MSDMEIGRLSSALKALKGAAGRYLYQPNAHEAEFFMSDALIKVILGGNRSGKTCTTALESIMQIEGWHPLQRENLELLQDAAVEPSVRDAAKKALDNEAWISSPPIRWRYIGPDYKFLKSVVLVELSRWGTADEIKSNDFDDENERTITWRNGSVADFMTYGQNMKKHGGVALDGMSYDEEPPEHLFDEGLPRLVSREGRCLIGMTAAEGVSWAGDRLMIPGRRPEVKDIFSMNMSMRDNPVNSEKYVDRMVALCKDDLEVRIRIDGEMHPRGGYVLDNFKDEAPWVCDPFKIPRDGGDLWASIDIHPAKPHSVVWVWIDTAGATRPAFMGHPYAWAVAELRINGHMGLLAGKMKEVEAALGRSHDRCLMDPLGWGVDQSKVDRRSAADDLGEHGIYPERGSKDKSTGIIRLNGWMSKKWIEDVEGAEPVVAEREFPILQVFSTLRRLRWEIKNWRYATRITKDGYESTGKPVEKNDDTIEALRRIAIAASPGVEMVEDENENDALMKSIYEQHDFLSKWTYESPNVPSYLRT